MCVKATQYLKLLKSFGDETRTDGRTDLTSASSSHYILLI